MPIYEYKCLKCNHNFEELVLGNTKVKCPKCKDNNPEKKVSTFSSKSNSLDIGSSSSSNCSSCTSSNCGSCGS